MPSGQLCPHRRMLRRRAVRDHSSGAVGHSPIPQSSNLTTQCPQGTWSRSRGRGNEETHEENVLCCLDRWCGVAVSRGARHGAGGWFGGLLLLLCQLHDRILHSMCSDARAAHLDDHLSRCMHRPQLPARDCAGRRLLACRGMPPAHESTRCLANGSRRVAGGARWLGRVSSDACSAR
jgi:hypothetical protein